MGRRKNGLYLFYIALAVVVILFFLGRYKRLEGFEAGPIKSIIINLQGGLGNQLFVYAGGLTLKNKHNVPLFLLPTDENSNIHSKKDYRFLFDGATPIEYTDERMKETREVGIQNNFFGPWRDIPTDENTNILIKYHWFQDFPSIKAVIPQVKNEVVNHLSDIYKDVSIDTSSAFIHVRRGDYTKEAGGAYALNMDYYGPGLEELNKSDNIENIYIFSDDMAWCKQQKWNTTKQIKYIDEPDELKTLYMMSQCEGGAVISNSTFSTWGAFLGPYLTSGVIVYPSKWLFNGNLSLPTEWIQK
jgi:hypothetical protein